MTVFGDDPTGWDHAEGANARDHATPQARPDLLREQRRGIPEVILAEPKTTDQIIAIARQFTQVTGRALISRIAPAVADEVSMAIPDATPRYYALARALILSTPTYHAVGKGGHIGILSAGTSDIPVAEEARFIAEAMEVKVSCVYDVGVAGVHRLFEPLNALIADGVDAIVVAAGMDGALPSLVAGLAPVPVIGLPTPVGYGHGGMGEAALSAMLQSCAPGLAVVNIGNGIGAGSFAALIARRAAHVRPSSPQPTSPQSSSVVQRDVCTRQ